MSLKEMERAMILHKVKSKTITLKKASSLLGLSYPQAKRLWSGFKKEGPKGLISKKRGKKSNRAVPKEQRQEIAKIINDNYCECKPLFVSEKLEERHNIKFSSEFIRQLMIEYHLWIPGKSKKKIHQRRERRECEGELVHADASDHDWFEGRGPRCHLHLLIDDATSKILGAYFAPEETTEGYFRACLPYFEKEGLPINFYNDKRGTFIVNQGKNRGETQFARAMKELGVKMIFAHSPQAKGRIERAFGTLQDRLVWEMRIAGISNIEEANRFLPSFFEEFNKRFSIEPANSFNAHRQLNQSQPLKYILCTKDVRKVTKNLEVQFCNTTYQLKPPSDLQEELKRSKVEVITTLDGEVAFQYKGKMIEHKKFSEIPYFEKRPSVNELIGNWKDRPGICRPGKDHPWRKDGVIGKRKSKL
jgi:transposase